MAKTQALDGTDLTPVKPHSQSATRQRGVVPSAELVPMQFKMPREFVRAFKVAAASNDMKFKNLAPSGRTLLISVPDASPTASSHPQVCQR